MNATYQSLFAKPQPKRRPFGTGSSESATDITIERAAQDWNVSQSTIYRWIKSGKLSAKKLAPIDGGRIRFFLDGDAREAGSHRASALHAKRHPANYNPYAY